VNTTDKTQVATTETAISKPTTESIIETETIEKQVAVQPDDFVAVESQKKKKKKNKRERKEQSKRKAEEMAEHSSPKVQKLSTEIVLSASKPSARERIQQLRQQERDNKFPPLPRAQGQFPIGAEATGFGSLQTPSTFANLAKLGKTKSSRKSADSDELFKPGRND
jgi:G3E family GTPase